jgi:hypothetical protein
MPHFIVNNRILLAACIAIAALDGGLIVFDGRPSSGRTCVARDMAKELHGTSVEAGDYRERDSGPFPGALRVDALRRALEGARPPVLLSSACARQVVETLGLAASIVVWVEPASPDDRADREGASSLDREVEAYIATYDARMRPDGVVYLDGRERWGGTA